MTHSGADIRSFRFAGEPARRVFSAGDPNGRLIGEQARRRNENPRSSLARSGFTLVELLVVIGIILVLIGLLFPAIAAVRRQAAISTTKQEMSRLQSAINAYYLDYRAYPGPIPESMLASTLVTSPPYISPSYTLQGINGSQSPTVVTSSENLYVGLCGTVTFPGTGTPTFGYTAPTVGPPGPASLNAANPGTHLAYMNYSPRETTYDGSTDPQAGMFSNANNGNIIGDPDASDSIIPEFVDHFSPARPILYMRARVGIACLPGANTMLNHIGQNNAATCQYDENQLVPYGWVATPAALSSKNALTQMGPGTRTDGTTDYPLPTPNPGVTGGFTYTSDDVYFANPAQWGTPIGKDGYILISAGPDGIYGTKDDIILGSGS